MRHLSTGPVMLWEGSVQYHREGWRYPRNGLLSQSSDVILVICTGQTSLTVHLDATALLHALGFTGKENNEQEWIAAIRCLMARTSRGPLKNGLYRGVVVDDQLHRCASGCRRFDQPASHPMPTSGKMSRSRLSASQVAPPTFACAGTHRRRRIHPWSCAFAG